MYPTSTPETLPFPWQTDVALAPAAVERVRDWWERASRVYPPATLKAWRCDWAVFVGFCSSTQCSPLPATPEAVAQFIGYCLTTQRKPATIRRYLSTISKAHQVARLLNPCTDEIVKLGLKGMERQVPARQDQARGLVWTEIEQFLNSAGESLRATRERALLCVAYDTMARRSELVALNLEDIQFLPDGSGRALIRRSKTDQAGEGSTAYLSQLTVRHLKQWLERGNIVNGALFRRIIGRGTVTTDSNGRGRIGDRLSVDAVAQAYKRVAQWIQLPPGDVADVSGHSTRVGATQDLLALNVDLASIMREGRWTTVRMPMRYGEDVMAARGGMARAASAQGRSNEDLHASESA